MNLIPPFELNTFLRMPWEGDAYTSTLWVVLMGFFVASACGLVGNYLILRRMALVGDAISHSVLPGIAIAFLLTNSRGSGAMFVGALAAGVVTTIIIEIIHKKSRVKQDAAIGIAFTSLFAIGVILINVYASKVDLDQECVLYGEIGLVPSEQYAAFAGVEIGPESAVRMGIVAVITVMLILCFWKELLVSSFDPGLATAIGINATIMHYGLMSWLSVVVVSAFEAVGAILVIAMLILPGATAALCTPKLWMVMLLTVVYAALSAVLGVHVGYWLNCSIAAAMAVMGSLLFVLAWLFSPYQGLIGKFLRTKADMTPGQADPEAASSAAN